LADYDIALDKQAELLTYWSTHQTDLLSTYKALANRVHDDSGSAYSLNRVVINSLNGDPYFVSGPIVEMIRGASEDIPSDWSINKELFITKRAFIWMDRPIALKEVRVDCGDAGIRPNDLKIHGLSWCFMPEHNSVLIVIWGTYFDTQIVQPLSNLEFEFNDKTTLESWVRDYFEVSNILKFLGSFLLFINQNILVSTKRKCSRSCERRIDKLAPILAPQDIHDINVISLRKAKHKSTDTHVEIEWSCQWVVRGHWRNQYYPSVQGNIPIWILPYIKGPDDKPLRNPEHVFQVIR
jgi:hypothetical protein